MNADCLRLADSKLHGGHSDRWELNVRYVRGASLVPTCLRKEWSWSP
jgi:hypothetical protein